MVTENFGETQCDAMQVYGAIFKEEWREKAPLFRSSSATHRHSTAHLQPKNHSKPDLNQNIN